MSEMTIIQGSDSRLSTLKSLAYYKKLFATDVDTPFLIIDRSEEDEESCLFTQDLMKSSDDDYKISGSAMFCASVKSDLPSIQLKPGCQIGSHVLIGLGAVVDIRRIPTAVAIGYGAVVGQQSSLRHTLCIGHYAKLIADCTLHEFVEIGDYTQIHSGEIERKAVIGAHTEIGSSVQIGAYAKIGDNCVLNDDVVVSAFSSVQSGVKLPKGARVISGDAVLDDSLPEGYRILSKSAQARIAI